MKTKPNRVPKIEKVFTAPRKEVDYSFWFSDNILDWYAGTANRKWRQKYQDSKKML